VTIELSHIGESLIAEMLSRLSAQGQLQQVCCAVTGIDLTYDLGAASGSFFPNQASVQIHSHGQTFFCDGAQKIDVLCVGEEGAIGIEAKLGETRMSLSEFPKRFCKSCEISGHIDPRIKGNMVAVLDGSLPFEDRRILATLGNRSWPLPMHWWLVIRERVWTSWMRSVPLRFARILVFEQLARLSCRTATEFNDLVLQVIGKDFAEPWKITFNEQ
jgi:hypothetical protein